jgi:hypothetical protein
MGVPSILGLPTFPTTGTSLGSEITSFQATARAPSHARRQRGGPSPQVRPSPFSITIGRQGQKVTRFRRPREFAPRSFD